jgi:hypothetical protein
LTWSARHKELHLYCAAEASSGGKHVFVDGSRAASAVANRCAGGGKSDGDRLPLLLPHLANGQHPGHKHGLAPDPKRSRAAVRIPKGIM